MGHCNNEGKDSGDLLIRVNLLPDNYFSRKGANIYAHLPLTLIEVINVLQAVLGVNKIIKTLSGNKEILVKENI